MSIGCQGHFFTIYFPGFVCFVLYLDKISGECLQNHWSSGLSNYLPLQIWTLKICNHDISKTITARSFKLGQLMGVMRKLIGENFKKSYFFSSNYLPLQIWTLKNCIHDIK